MLVLFIAVADFAFGCWSVLILHLMFVAFVSKMNRGRSCTLKGTAS